MPGIGGSLFLIAVGAILNWAVTVDDPNGFNINTAGVILMVVGAIGLVLSGIYYMTRRRTDIVTEGPVGTRQTTISEAPRAY